MNDIARLQRLLTLAQELHDDQSLYAKIDRGLVAIMRPGSTPDETLHEARLYADDPIRDLARVVQRYADGKAANAQAKADAEKLRVASFNELTASTATPLTGGQANAAILAALDTDPRSGETRKP